MNALQAPNYTNPNIRESTLRALLAAWMDRWTIGVSNDTVLIQTEENRERVEALIRACPDGNILIRYISIDSSPDN
jgi:hypothetical protein